MVCISCGKESKNLRVCPYCFTPYPAQAAQKRQTQRVNRAGSAPQQVLEKLKDYYETARVFVMRQTPVVRWSGLGIIIVLVAWLVTGGGGREFEVGVVQSEIIATPLQREEGQLALVQQFTQADEIVEGRKRRIFFYNPNGKLFAQADGVRGVVLTR
jgi:hypothetical protein